MAKKPNRGKEEPSRPASWLVDIDINKILDDMQRRMELARDQHRVFNECGYRDRDRRERSVEVSWADESAHGTMLKETEKSLRTKQWNSRTIKRGSMKALTNTALRGRNAERSQTVRSSLRPLGHVTYPPSCSPAHVPNRACWRQSSSRR